MLEKDARKKKINLFQNPLRLNVCYTFTSQAAEGTHLANGNAKCIITQESELVSWAVSLTK